MELKLEPEQDWVRAKLELAGLTRVPLALSNSDQEPFPPPLAPNESKHGVRLLTVSDEQIARTAFSSVVRRVPHDTYRHLLTGAVRPRAGDIVLARVQRVGHHTRIEHPSGRRRPLEPGMDVVLACANRYATDQFEAYVPPSLGSAHLIAAGGLAGIVTNRARTARRPTEIDILGVFANDDGVAFNVRDFAMEPVQGFVARPPVLAVFGTSMNSGKTTASRFMTRGLVRAGYKVGYAKVTGTGSGGDRWAIKDEGASTVLDFTDAGLASTFKTPIPIIEHTLVHLVEHLAADGCDRVVLEFADGLFQEETAALLKSETVHAVVDRVIFAAGDSLGAISGAEKLTAHGFRVVGIAGLVTASPLPLREAQAAGPYPVWSAEELSHPEIAAALVAPAVDTSSVLDKIEVGNG